MDRFLIYNYRYVPEFSEGQLNIHIQRYSLSKKATDIYACVCVCEMNEFQELF